MSSSRPEARREAMRVLAAAGWSAERIALALSPLSRSTVERVLSQPAPEPMPTPPTPIPPGRCCERVEGLYCDQPVGMPGEVFCAQHTRPGAWTL